MSTLTLDVRCVADDPAKAHEALRSMPEVLDVIAGGETKTSVRFAIEIEFGRWSGALGDGGIFRSLGEARTLIER